VRDSLPVEGFGNLPGEAKPFIQAPEDRQGLKRGKEKRVSPAE
jgi:hypothetical protein